MTASAWARFARLADPIDNVAIAISRIPAGTELELPGGRRIRLRHTVPEAHRFSIRSIPAGDEVLSWGLPFGRATQAIQPGDYVCNQMTLELLAGHRLTEDWPASANFADYFRPFSLSPATVRVGAQVAVDCQATFAGYARPGGRGVGTRNHVVVIGTSSRTAGFARAVAARFGGARSDGLDGVVAVAHTEGGSRDEPHNLEMSLRTLAGFAVHPNVGAVLFLDIGDEALNNARLLQYLRAHGYAIDAVPHACISIGQQPGVRLEAAATQISAWLTEVPATRSPQPASALRLALQCGGSDAFSGISANPLVGLVARELLRHGGSACLAETTELIGAESYILQNVRDLATAETFLGMIARYRARASWHGHSPEGNPSGGNRLRGLYNIVVKSIGAALKKAADVRLDFAIEYGQQMQQPGYYFMDSPGNDLESIAGQVAAGSNLIYFTTGNGSVTNFPFVPTLKFVTTTGRYELLADDMDINAGAYLDGTPMSQLIAETFGETLAVAAGKPTIGERTGQAQVQLWRDWAQTGPADVDGLLQQEGSSAKPLPWPSTWPKSAALPEVPAGATGLILPTSLCSGQVAALVAAKLNQALPEGFTRFVAVPHTEGCGSSSHRRDDLAVRTLLGYLQHDDVSAALLLEHGCEKFHNRFFQDALAATGLDPTRFGWASVQLDGGIDAVRLKICQWASGCARRPAVAKPLQLGLHVTAALTPRMRELAQRLGAAAAAGGASLVLSPAAAAQLRVEASPTLGYGQRAPSAGLHVMDVIGEDDVEILTGLGATGCRAVCVMTAGAPVQPQPLVPVLTVAEVDGEVDFVLGDQSPAAAIERLSALLVRAVAGDYQSALAAGGVTAFQISRGRCSISL